MFEIVDAQDTRTPLKLMEDHITSSPDDPWSTCPWVKCGNLYMSVTQTATKSWGNLLDNIGTGNGVTVFSGRHGTQAGQAVGEHTGTFNTKLVLESDFYATDLGTAQSYKGAVKVLNAADINTTKGIRDRTKTLLNTDIVIYAWCHSLFTMMDHSEELYSDTYKVKGKAIAVISRALYLVNKSVKSLTTEWYDWV